MTSSARYPIGTPGAPWGAAERAIWLSQQSRKRSYETDVVSRMASLQNHWELLRYGAIDAGGDHYPLFALRSRDWRDALPAALITGGVHGYETSGVHGALLFAEQQAQRFSGRVNLLIAPCVSPWAYERIHRWNADAVDPNRSFRADSPAAESCALMQLVAPLDRQFLLHIDLHETTDSDESEFRPALAARDGKLHEVGSVPDGFYLVGDTQNPALDFQQAIIAAVRQITHIAPADANGQIIGADVVSPGVILYPFRALGLCAGLTHARYTTTTEVYPDSPRATNDQCNRAQARAVCAALDYVLDPARGAAHAQN